MMIKYENELYKFKHDDVEYQFPFEPYQCQHNIIRGLITTFKSKNNAIIESPTGTGKCLSALSAAFAYLKKNYTNKNFLEEKRLKKKYYMILSTFEGFIPILNKILKKLKRQTKVNSIKHVIEELNNDNKNDKSNHSDIEQFIQEFPSVLLKPDIILERINDLEKGIRSYLLSILKNYQFEESILNDIEGKINILYNLMSISQNKIKDKLKNMTFSHCIIYTVRTSSQMDVVYDEYTKLPKDFNAAFLKSRNFFCLNEIASSTKNTILNRKCAKLIKEKECNHYMRFKTKPEDSKFKYTKDLSFYKAKRQCPYYSEFENAKFADIIVCSYSYLFNRRVKDNPLDYAINPILLIDEGHNILSVCEEYLNFKITVNDIIEAIEGIILLKEDLNPNDEKIKESNIISNIDDVLDILFIFVNSLIFLNQNLSDDIYFQKVYKYKKYIIFDVIANIFNTDKFIREYHKDSFFISDNLDIDNEKCMDYHYSI